MTPTPESLPWCCFTDGDGHCAKSAEFRIYTKRRGGVVAGPDLYGDETDSCNEHIGQLLGWQPEAENVGEIEWLVVQLALRGDPA